MVGVDFRILPLTTLEELLKAVKEKQYENV